MKNSWIINIRIIIFIIGLITIALVGSYYTRLYLHKDRETIESLIKMEKCLKASIITFNQLQIFNNAIFDFNNQIRKQKLEASLLNTVNQSTEQSKQEQALDRISLSVSFQSAERYQALSKTLNNRLDSCIDKSKPSN